MDKIRFSDIIKFILLGGVGAFLIATVSLTLIPGDFIDSLLQAAIWVSERSEQVFKIASNTIVGVALLAFFYLIGIAIQGLRIAICNLVARFNCVKTIGNNDSGTRRRDKILYVLIKFCHSFYFYSYDKYCMVLRGHTDKGNDTVPGWIYLSHDPSRLTDIIASSVCGSLINDGQDDDNTNRYLNEFLVSICVLLRFLWAIVLICILVRLWNGETWDGSMPIRFCCTLCVALMALEVILTTLARAYAINYIDELTTRFTAKYVTNDEHLRKLMYSQGAPVAYIGIRVGEDNGRSTNYAGLRNALESISKQRYLNTHVIVLDDSDGHAPNAPSPCNVIAEFSQDGSSGGEGRLAGKISYCRKKCDGPAGALQALREQFLKAGAEDDIFIMLDDDDQLHSAEAVYDIVLSLKRNRAGICLGCFESVDALGIDITNNGGSTHNSIAASLAKHPQTALEQGNIHMASSIGWTKSYTRKALNDYYQILEKRKEQFAALHSYEDFPDIIALLMKDTVLTGVVRPTHAYYKRDNSITGSPTLEAFKTNRAGFLALTIQLAHDNQAQLCKGAIDEVVRFVIFKSLQICNILAKYRIMSLKEFQTIAPLDFFPQALAKALSACDMAETARRDIISTYKLKGTDKLALKDVICAAMRAEYESGNNKQHIDLSDLKTLEKQQGKTQQC